MGSTGLQGCNGWLGTVKALLFTCCEPSDPPAAPACVVCGSHLAGDDCIGHQAPIRQSPPGEKHRHVFYQQPAPMPPPSAKMKRSFPLRRGRRESERPATEPAVTDIGWIERTRRSDKSKSPRPMISGPYNFQHTGTGAGSLMGSAADLPPSAQSLRPLELSLPPCIPRVSPLMPYLTFHGAPSPPESGLVTHRAGPKEDASTSNHSRSNSSGSFQIPRRPVHQGTAVMTAALDSFGDSPPEIPARAPNRPRAYTSPVVEAIVERIASAIIEKDKLEEALKTIKERQSLCLTRPSSLFGHSDDQLPTAPMPLMPHCGPSFSERLSIDRPRTAPSMRSTFETGPCLPPPPLPQPLPTYRNRSQAVDEQDAQQTSSLAVARPLPASAFNSHPPWCSPQIIDDSSDSDKHFAPPLPLILRPPLRKKKSFSQVSSWLFSAGVKDRDQQVPSCQLPRRKCPPAYIITNTPRALTGRDGFYQTLAPSAILTGQRSSFGSMSDSTPSQTEFVYSTDEDDEDDDTLAGEGTYVTGKPNWSPGCTPLEDARRKAGPFLAADRNRGGHSASLSLTRTGTFGSRDRPVSGVVLPASRPTSVGLAF